MKLQSDAEEGAGEPPVLADVDVVVVIDGVAQHDGCSGVETVGEVIDDSGALVEDHVETCAAVFLLIVVHRELVVLVEHKGGHRREVE